MFGLLLGGLLGRAAAGGAARAMASRPLLGGLMSRRAGGGAGGSPGVGGTSSPGPSEQATTIKQAPPEATAQPAAQQAEARQEAPQPPAEKPVVNEVAEGLSERPTLQEQKPQPSNPTTPVKPLEGLLDNPAAPSPPQPVAGTKIDAPQPIASTGPGPQATATPMEDTFPNSPDIAPAFLADRTSQLPPRTTFVAPDGNPSKAIDTSTKVNNSSPGYSTVGMTTPSSAAPQFSYLRR